MGYLSEFRWNWPNLLGAGLGLAFGTAFNHYMSNLFGPALMAEFGWTKSQWSLVNALGLAGIVFTPIAGRIADRFGPRVAAGIGFASLPISYVMLSQMGGNIYHLYAIMLFKLTFGIMTATMVFTRVVVERFDKARGVALACLLSCPPLAGTLGAPLIGWVIAEHGWRTAYLVMACLAAVAGLVTVYLIGRYSLGLESRENRAIVRGTGGTLRPRKGFTCNRCYVHFRLLFSCPDCRPVRVTPAHTPGSSISRPAVQN